MEELLKKYDIKEPDCGAWCGPGWIPLIDELISNLISMGWSKKLVQVKQKFGSLRFYAGDTTPLMDDLIEEYCLMSAHCCEECGGPGKIKTIQLYMTCICPECERKG